MRDCDRMAKKDCWSNTLDAYEEYYRKRAALWEIQSLRAFEPSLATRRIGEQFQTLANALANFSKPANNRGLHRRIGKSTSQRCADRIAKERTPRGEEHLAIKTGHGGLVDAEFMAQTFCLENGWSEPNTLKGPATCQRSGPTHQKR